MFSSQRLLSWLTWLLYATVALTPLFYLKQGVYPYTLPKTLFFQALVEAAAVVWIALIIVDRRFRPRLTLLTGAIVAFLFVLTLSAVLGTDPWRSFWSTQERALGVVTFYHCGVLAVIIASLREHISIKKLWYVAIASGLLVSTLAFIQLKIPNLLLNEPIGDQRVGSTFGNPTFLAGYLLLLIFAVVYWIINSVRSGKQHVSGREIFFFGVALATFLVGLFVTKTRGDIIALGFGLVVLALCFAVAPPPLKNRFLSSRWLYVILVAVLLTGGLGFFFTRKSTFWERIPPLRRFRDLSLDNRELIPRFAALSAALKGFREKPFVGWGWENFNVVFNKYYDPRTLEINYQETRFDKPHNVFAEMLVSGGVPLAVTYYALIVIACIEAWRRGGRGIGSIVTAGSVAYIVRNLVVFDTLGPVLVAAVALGWVGGMEPVGKAPQPVISKKLNRERDSGTSQLHYGALFLSVLGVVLIYELNIQSLIAVYRQFWGFQYFIQAKPARAIESFKDAGVLWSPYRWMFQRDYATAVAEAYFNNPGRIPETEARLAVAAMERVVAEHPADAYNHYSLVDMYNQISDVDKETYLAKAEQQAAIAMQLTPNRQEVYFSLAKTKSLEGNYKEALRLLDVAISLSPSVPDAHFYAGLISFALEDNTRGFKEIQQAIALGRKWRRYNEPRVVANFFADSGHLPEAIALYKQSLEMKSDEPETKIKLGIAYFLNGDRASARAILGEVLKTFDIRQSPLYSSVAPIVQSLHLAP